MDEIDEKNKDFKEKSLEVENKISLERTDEKPKAEFEKVYFFLKKFIY